MLESRVIELFHQSIGAKMACGESLAPEIAAASELAAQQLLQGNKIIACGNGICASLASIFCQSLTLQHRFERPGLPAITLSNDAATLTAIAEQHSKTDIYGKQLKLLGQPGDVLVAISGGNNSAALLKAIQTAHIQEMFCIALCTERDTDVTALLRNEDIQLDVHGAEPHRLVEIHLLSLLTICELIDQQLFGGIA